MMERPLSGSSPLGQYCELVVPFRKLNNSQRISG